MRGTTSNAPMSRSTRWLRVAAAVAFVALVALLVVTFARR
jgi:hypothetical protein